MANPTFGEKKEGVSYKTRYGVYAVIPDSAKEKIILVQAPNGAWFLPGGEIEVGEDHFEALKRELIENQDLQPRLVNIMAKQTNTSTLAIVIPTTTILPIYMKLLLIKKPKHLQKTLIT